MTTSANATSTDLSLGLTASVYTNPTYRGCANGGISERVTRVTIVGTKELTSGDHAEIEPLARGSRVSEATPDAPAVVLVYRRIGKVVVHAEPLETQGQWHMSGGAFIASSDSRLSDLVDFYGAISLHDRVES